MQNFQNGFNPYAQNVSIAKLYFKKPTILTQGILYTASVIFSIASSFFMMPALRKYMEAIFAIPEITADMSQTEVDFMSAFTGIYTNIMVFVSAIPSMIILALTALAFFIMYNKSKNEDPKSSPSAGVTILFVLSIIQLIPTIFASLIILIAIIAMLIIGIATSSEGLGDTGFIWVLSAIYTVVFGGMIALMLTYSINQVRYYGSIKKSLTTVNLTCKGAGIFGVFSILHGAYMAFSSLSAFSVKPIMNLMIELSPELEPFIGIFKGLSLIFVLSAVSSVLSAATLIVNGIIALGYKKHIKSFTEGYCEFSTEQPLITQPEVSPVEQAPVVEKEAVTVPPTVAETPAPSTEAPQFEPVVFNEGTEFVQTVHCPRCGTPAKNDDVFCKACGTKL